MCYTVHGVAKSQTRLSDLAYTQAALRVRLGESGEGSEQFLLGMGAGSRVRVCSDTHPHGVGFPDGSERHTGWCFP